MADRFYKTIWLAGRMIHCLSCCPIILHARRVPTEEAAILAPNHLSYFDVPCLMGAIRRPIDFVSIRELMDRPWAGRFLRRMNALRLDRGKVDAAAVRDILDRLAQRRLVAMFPEGQIRPPEKSILRGGHFGPNVLRLAKMANVSIIPTAVIGTDVMNGIMSWLPTGQSRYGIAFGNPIPPDHPAGMDEMRRAYTHLYQELMDRLGRPSSA